MQGLKQATQNLLQAYLDRGSRDVLGASKAAIVAKFSALALAAVAIGASTYGIIYEAATLAVAALFPSWDATVQKLAAHAAILVVFVATLLIVKVATNPKGNTSSP